MIQYKGKGEHSVNQLEQIIEQQNEELHQLKTLHIKYLDRLREQYKEVKQKISQDIFYLNGYEQAKKHYDVMRLFCLDCELLTFNDIEVMESEVNQSIQ